MKAYEGKLSFDHQAEHLPMHPQNLTRQVYCVVKTMLRNAISSAIEFSHVVHALFFIVSLDNL